MIGIIAYAIIQLILCTHSLYPVLDWNHGVIKMEIDGTPLEAVPGVGPAIAKKLREQHIINAEYLARQTSSAIMWTTKIGEYTCKKIIKNAREVLGYELRSGVDLETSQNTSQKLSTGLDVIDEKLFGGFPTGSLVEVYGASRGGKSHLLTQLAVHSLLPQEQGGFETKVIWLMTGMSFRPLSVRSAAIRFGMDDDTALGRIAVQEVVNSEHLQDILQTLPDIMAETGTRVLVIDSLGGLFQVEYAGFGHRRTVEKELVQVMMTLRHITCAVDGFCLYTNHVYEQISSYGGNPQAAMNGHIMAHNTDFRFFLRKRVRAKRALALRKAPDIPEFDTELEIGYGGFFKSKMDRIDTERKVKDSLTTYFPPRIENHEGVEILDESV